MSEAANDNPEPAFFRHRRMVPVEASEYLSARLGCSVAVATLSMWRAKGVAGPLFHKVGRRVVYERADLDAWIVERLGPARRSTSEPVRAA